MVAGCREASFDAVASGDRTFANVCARCHGQDGTGGLPAANGVRPRDLTDPAWQTSVGDGQLFAIVASGRAPMPAFGKTLNNDEIRAVVDKVRRLRKETRR